MVGIGEIEHAHGDHADSTGSTCCELTPALHRKGPVSYIINRRLTLVWGSEFRPKHPTSAPPS